MIWIVVAVIGIGAGFATPIFLMGDSSAEQDSPSEPERPKLPIPDPSEDVGFIVMEPMVVNFNDPRFSRYLKVILSLQVAKSQIEDVNLLLTEKNDLLINWMIGHIADKRVDEFRGKQAANQLRREIHDAFNHLLFSDGIERIQDVLFKELNVQ